MHHTDLAETRVEQADKTISSIEWASLLIKTRLMIVNTMLAMSAWEEVSHGHLRQEMLPQSKKMISTRVRAVLLTVAPIDMSRKVGVVAHGEIVKDQVERAATE